MKKKIIILYPNSFPIGGAASNRVLHIAKAIQGGGNVVEVIITRGTEKKDKVINTKTNGKYKSIEYYYSTKSVLWPTKSFFKLLNIIIGHIRTLMILIKSYKKIDMLIIYGDYNIFTNFSFFIFSKVFRKKTVYCVDEYPWAVVYSNNSIFSIIYLRYFYRLFDAFIVMTKALMNYYSTLIRKNSQMFHLPMTVDIERFDVNVVSDCQYYIAYCGSDGTGLKEGLDIVVRAFKKVNNKYPKLKLFIAGIIHPSINALIKELKLTDKVYNLGFIKYDEIPVLLKKAKALCLARTDIIQNHGNFPTKLGEYLASGVPVITTNVGEVPFYLIDNFNAFLVAPNDVDAFAEKIDYVLTNVAASREVGHKGRLLAENVFNYKKYEESLNNFLLSLLSQR